MLTNTQRLLAFYTLSHEGACGASVIVSFALSSPAGMMPPQGRFMLCLTNQTSNVPLHLEPRLVWADPDGTEQSTPLAMDLISNTQTFGGSAHQIRSLVLLLSGQNAALPLQGVAGSALRIAIMAASNPASAAVVSGVAAIYQL